GAWSRWSPPNGRRSPVRPTRTVALIAVLIILLAAVPPAPLGAFAAALRAQSGRAPPVRSFFPPFSAATNRAVAMSLSDFVSRALYDSGGSLRRVTVRLVGFAGSLAWLCAVARAGGASGAPRPQSDPGPAMRSIAKTRTHPAPCLRRVLGSLESRGDLEVLHHSARLTPQFVMVLGQILRQF